MTINKLGYLFITLFISQAIAQSENFIQHEAAFKHLTKIMPALAKSYCDDGLIENYKYFSAPAPSWLGVQKTWVYELAIETKETSNENFGVLKMKASWPSSVGAFSNEDFNQKVFAKIGCHDGQVDYINTFITHTSSTKVPAIKKALTCADYDLLEIKPLQINIDDNADSLAYDEHSLPLDKNGSGLRDVQTFSGPFYINNTKKIGHYVTNIFKVENPDTFVLFNLSHRANIEHGIDIMDSGLGQCGLHNFCISTDGTFIQNIKPCQTPGSALSVKYYSFY